MGAIHILTALLPYWHVAVGKQLHNMARWAGVVALGQMVGVGAQAVILVTVVQGRTPPPLVVVVAVEEVVTGMLAVVHRSQKTTVAGAGVEYKFLDKGQAGQRELPPLVFVLPRQAGVADRAGVQGAMELPPPTKQTAEMGVIGEAGVDWGLHNTHVVGKPLEQEEMVIMAQSALSGPVVRVRFHQLTWREAA